MNMERYGTLRILRFAGQFVGKPVRFRFVKLNTPFID